MSVFSKLKQFKDMRQQGKKLQSALEGETVAAEAAGGGIKLIMDGNLKISDLKIDPSLLAPDKKEKLENAIKDAHGDALRKMQRVIAAKMQGMDGLKLPGAS